MAKKAVTADNVVRRLSMMLPVRLTPDELLERGSALAHQRQVSVDHEMHAADIKKRLKERTEEISMETGRLAAIIRTKQEPREVTVEVRLAKRKGWVDEVRLDTGEVIHTRQMTGDESQTDMLEMPFDAVPAPGELEA